jgi:stress-induced morphogen
VLVIMMTKAICGSPLTNASLFNPLLYLKVRRSFSATSYEQKIEAILRAANGLKNPSKIEVEDRSGGCGANFYILVESSVFKGIPRIKQHRIVQDILKDEIAKWHAVSIETRVPVIPS